MHQKDELIYNTAVTTLFVNLYFFAKKDNKIKLKGFDYNKPQHILILNTANNLIKFYPQMSIQIEMSFLKKLKFRFSKNYLPFKRVKNLEVEKTCDDYINDIEQYYYKNLFYDIAIDYYYGDQI